MYLKEKGILLVGIDHGFQIMLSLGYFNPEDIR